MHNNSAVISCRVGNLLLPCTVILHTKTTDTTVKTPLALGHVNPLIMAKYAYYIFKKAKDKFNHRIYIYIFKSMFRRCFSQVTMCFGSILDYW